LLDQQEGRIVLKRKHELGVSLTELMVVLVILGVVMGIAIPSYRTWVVNTQISVKAQAILNGLQLARAEALKRNTGIVFAMVGGSSWSVGCEAAVADRDGDGLADCPAVIHSKAVEEGGQAVSVTVTPDGNTHLTYNGIGMVRSANADGSGPIAQIDLDSGSVAAGASRELRILVTSGGMARLCDPGVAANGDPRRC
jgi:type IV fimbrial biogenesis protein FimT